MQDASLEELKRRIAAGEYAVDSRELAGEILTKMALVRRVARFLESEGEEAEAATDARRAPRPRTRGGSRPSPTYPLRSRRERLQ